MAASEAAARKFAPCVIAFEDGPACLAQGECDEMLVNLSNSNVT